MKTDSLIHRVNIKRIVIAMAVTTGLVLTSCTQEKLEGDAVTPIGGNVELRFRAFAADKADVEKTVNRVRVVVFGSYQSADRGKLIYNKVATARADGSIDRILISAGLRDIYLIVNEPTDETQRYDAISTSDELRNMQVFYKGGVTAEAALKDGLPMFSSYINQMVTGESNVFGTGVEYLLAKVSLNIEFTKGGITEVPNVGDVEVTGMKVCNIPYYGTLAPLTYSSSDYHTADVKVNITSDISDKTTTYFTEFYLPEHIVKSADSKTFVEVKGKNRTTGETSTWIVKLGDATVTAPPAAANTPYNITRNMHYTVTGTIKSYGEVDVNLKVEIAPWGTINTGANAGEYIVCETNNVTLTRDRDGSSTTAPVTFLANNMAGAVIISKNGRVDVDKADIANGKLTLSLNLGVDIPTIDDYDNYDEVSIIVDNYVHTIKVSYLPVIEMTKQEPAVGTPIPWSGGVGKVTCRTTVGEWYIILKDDKGNEYARSEKTAFVTTGQIEQSRELQIPVNIDGVPINYIVEVHHETLLPENEFSTKHMFRNRQEAGYKLVLVPDGTSEKTPVSKGGEGATLSSVAPNGDQHNLFFKYGSVIGIENYIINDVRTNPTDNFDKSDVAWVPTGFYNVITSWNAIPMSQGLFKHTKETIQQGKGDPCRLVGLSTLDLIKGKVDNEKWKMSTDTELTNFVNGDRLPSMAYSILLRQGGVVYADGYRNNSGVIAQQMWTFRGPYSHALLHLYTSTFSQLCMWSTNNSYPSDVRPSGGVGSSGYMSAIPPNAQNGMSIRCTKIKMLP